MEQLWQTVLDDAFLWELHIRPVKALKTPFKVVEKFNVGFFKDRWWKIKSCNAIEMM